MPSPLLIDPVAFEIGPVSVRWYGLMYIFGLAACWTLLGWRAGRPGAPGWTREEVSDLVFYGAVGAVLGGRLGYIAFYDLPAYLSQPLAMLRVWEGGMSFHGGLLGAIVAMAWFARRAGRRFLEVSDFVAPAIPVALGLGRLGNFINGELWGAPTQLPWGVVFPLAGARARHPTQLYEAGLEGALMFALLWWFAARPRPAGAVSGLFLLLYALARGTVEFWREPDPHLGYLAFGWLTMGQLLSLPMLLGGLALLVYAARRPLSAGRGAA